MEKKREEKKRKLEEKKEDLKRHEKFHVFLENVVNDKDGDNKEFEQIEDL